METSRNPYLQNARRQLITKPLISGFRKKLKQAPGLFSKPAKSKEVLIYSTSSLRAAFSRERSVAGSNPEPVQYLRVMDRHVATLLAMTELFSASLK
jgi:hypothetical protein